MVPRNGLDCNSPILNPKMFFNFRTSKPARDAKPNKNGARRPRFPDESVDYWSLMFRALMIFAYFSYSFLK